jgi:uncharacterized protein (UPF0335 family)
LLEFVFKEKSDLKGKFITLFTDLKIDRLDVKFIRCNDSGENKTLFDECQSKGYSVKFGLNCPALKLLNATARGKESSKLSLEESESC